jgi:large conductance mechanosensitive channel
LAPLVYWLGNWSEVLKKELRNFMNFVRQQGVVGLAVGLAIGAQVTVVTNSIVANFINPIVGFILGGSDLSTLSWTIVEKGSLGGRSLEIGYGNILDATLRLLAIAAVVYYVVHWLKLDKLDKKKEA